MSEQTDQIVKALSALNERVTCVMDYCKTVNERVDLRISEIANILDNLNQIMSIQADHRKEINWLKGYVDGLADQVSKNKGASDG